MVLGVGIEPTVHNVRRIYSPLPHHWGVPSVYMVTRTGLAPALCEELVSKTSVSAIPPPGQKMAVHRGFEPLISTVTEWRDNQLH